MVLVVKSLFLDYLKTILSKIKWLEPPEVVPSPPMTCKATEVRSSVIVGGELPAILLTSTYSGITVR